MKIAHISDIHIRTLKYHDEYKRVFDDLVQKLSDIKPDLIINTGDTCHTKTNISPEFVQLTSELTYKLANISPYHIILGNHDLNLANQKRLDALTPIIDNIKSDRVFLHTKSDWFHYGDKHCYNFWVFSLIDKENWPLKDKYPSNEINIGLFHGPICDARTDSDFKIAQSEYDISMFDGLDYTMLGDIHKRQDFNDGRVAYAGSLIQQNFGEELVKGFLLWDIESKDKFTKQFIEVNGSKKFYTLSLNENLELENKDIEDNSRIRICSNKSLTLADKKQIESDVKKKYNTNDIMILSDSELTKNKSVLKEKDATNIRCIEEQKKLIRKFLNGRNISDDVFQEIFSINEKYQVQLEQNEDTTRNVSWNINKLLWNNLFNYGEANAVDFAELGGITGIFGHNAAGKSNFIDTILETLYDTTTRGVRKNVYLINDNKDNCSMCAELSINDKEFLIERSIERSKKKETGKMSCNFSRDATNLAGDTRDDTEKLIRHHIGSYEDMMLTSISAQWNPLDIIICKETKRKEILSRFLDLDLFDKKYKLAKEESKKYKYKLDEVDESSLRVSITDNEMKIALANEKLSKNESSTSKLDKEVCDIDEEIEKNVLLKHKISEVYDENSLVVKQRKLEEQKVSLSSLAEDKMSAYSSLKSNIDKFSLLESKFDVKSYEEKYNSYYEFEKQENELTDKVNKNKVQKVFHEKNANLLNEVPCGNSFPKCKFLLNAFTSKDLLVKLNEEIEKDIQKINSLSSEKQNLQKFVDKLNKFKELKKQIAQDKSSFEKVTLELKNLKHQIDRVEQDINNIKESISICAKNKEHVINNENVDKLVNGLKNNKNEKKSLLKQLNSEKESLLREVGLSQGIVDKLLNHLEEYKVTKLKYKAYELYIEAMGKDGISYQVLSSKLPVINEEINKVLSGIAEFNVSIENDVEEQSIRIYLQYGNYKRRLIELGSGAEKMLASIAIRVALLKISSLPKSNLFIIDEGFGKLDTKNIESIGKLLDYLKSMFEHVLIVTHLDILKDIVDNSIEVGQDKEGYAHIEIGG
jgi:DNA repair exonuclease SbcCD ATPase subunit